MKLTNKIWIIILLIVSGAILSVCFFHNNKMKTSKKDNNDGFINGYQMYEQYIRYTGDGEQRDYIWINEESIEIVFRELDSRLNISDMERLQAVIEKLGQGKEQIDVMIIKVSDKQKVRITLSGSDSKYYYTGITIHPQISIVDENGQDISRENQSMAIMETGKCHLLFYQSGCSGYFNRLKRGILQ